MIKKFSIIQRFDFLEELINFVLMQFSICRTIQKIQCNMICFKRKFIRFQLCGPIHQPSNNTVELE